MPASRDTRPVPDPTLLTTQQLIREINSLKEVVFTRLDGMDEAIHLFNANITRVPTDTDKQISHLKELHESKLVAIGEQSKAERSVISSRLDAMDKAVALVQAEHDIFPNRIDEKISAVAAVQNERFRSISVQFSERDTRAEQTSRDSKIAVDAALQAAKEAVMAQNISSAMAITKSESATIKQIDQQGLLIQTSTKALDDKIDDLKERLTRIEGAGAGKDSEKVSSRQSGSYMLAIIGFIVGTLISMVGMALSVFLRK